MTVGMMKYGVEGTYDAAVGMLKIQSTLDKRVVSTLEGMLVSVLMKHMMLLLVCSKYGVGAVWLVG
jgi:hypothetical protein